MARYRKKKALYEVIGQSRLKPTIGRAPEDSHPEQLDSGKDESMVPASGMEIAERPSYWPTRPRTFQFSAGRIEISVPYQLAVAVLLALVLLILVVYRLGQTSSSQVKQVSESSRESLKAVEPERAPTGPAPTAITKTPDPVEKTQPVEQKGNNRIVIQTYQTRTQLEPVKQYFASFGIETEIRQVGSWYYLVTKDKYENPERPGTEGYVAKERIIKLGANYKAPPGYESFGTQPFHDAYGMRFDD